ncbi:DUF5134 domain-containing protein [Streptomyces barkulensis]|uniref:DUF5134 domain-containing protein n=1 Tax=Streptomyces barkulensis TaxID=1257026 RepID=UPI000C6D3FB0|nr:DUF5134 domain-containing protein [Streptomyces barkulensis]
MHGPEPVGWMLVVLCGAVGAYCLRRTRGGTPGQRREAAGEAVMGLGMAVMALPASAVAPPPPAVFVALFGATAVYGLALLLFDGEHRLHHLHHTVGALAMLHMALAMADAPAHGHHAAPSAHPASAAATGALLVYFALYALLAGARLAPAPDSPRLPGTATSGALRGPAPRPPRAPEVAAACRLAMGIGMFAMLLTV